ncbi:MAG: T9SS type A sorting domain-containing protein [Bacteroidetes bacterium]|nr:T9SS type A sorting domain-containing protein [Bacteroidota bacterium]
MKQILLSTLCTLLLLGFINYQPIQAANYYVDVNTNWSSLSPLPTSADDVYVRSGAMLTVNISTASCRSITVGVFSTSFLSFNTGSHLTCSMMARFGQTIDIGHLIMTNGGILTTPMLFCLGTGTLTSGLGTIELTGSNTLPIQYTTYNNLTIYGGTNTLSVNTTINSDLVLAGGILDVSPSNYQLHLMGNWVNTGGTFNEQNGLVHICGAAATQTISNPTGESFYDLTAAKTSGLINLLNDITIVSTLTLSSNNINLGSSHIIIDNSASIIGGSSTSYIEADGSGTLRKLYPAVGSFTYPIGDNNDYSPAQIDITSGTFTGQPYIGINLTDSKHPSDPSSSNFLSRYWTVDVVGISSYSSNVTYTYVDADITGTEASIVTQKWNAAWSLFNPVNSMTNELSGVVTDLTIDFTGGNGSLLPIELVYFDAMIEYDEVNIMWTTASEINNDYYTIERSSDGINYEEIGLIGGAGNSQQTMNYNYFDEDPLYGISYYRLKQTDFDGKQEVFSPITLNNNLYVTSSQELTIYPNPTDGNSTINVMYTNSNNVKEQVFVVLYDITGKEIYSKVEVQEKENILIAIDPANKLAPGIYLVMGTSSNKISTKQKLIITE